MLTSERFSVPKIFEQDVLRAVNILREAGCSGVYLFGSVLEGNVRDDSDLDLAIRGCPSGRFYHLIGQLLLELEHPVDLVNLDTQDPFAHQLQKEGMLVQVG